MNCRRRPHHYTYTAPYTAYIIVIAARLNQFLSEFPIFNTLPVRIFNWICSLVCITTNAHTFSIKHNPPNDSNDNRKKRVYQTKYMICMSLVSPVIFIPRFFISLSLTEAIRVLLLGMYYIWLTVASRQFSNRKVPLALSILRLKGARLHVIRRANNAAGERRQCSRMSV